RGFDCHQVVLEGPAGQRILWIDVDNNVLRRMELPVEAQLPALDPHKEFSHYSVWIDYLEPTFVAEIDEQDFTLDIPEGARRMRRLVLPPPLPPLAILGQPVADFSFTTLEGEEVTPATLSGKVVLMEFWSKTCPPCREHTPLLDQVYRELKDSKDFVFYAVNANTAATSNLSVSRLFKSWGGSIPVLRDLQETSYTKLDIGAYPHTILVGRDGRLQMYQPGMHVRPEPLVATVRKLLDGEDLAAEVHAKHAERVERYERELEAAMIQEKPPEPITQTPTEE
ncbi:MAG: TlpA family protein disulfide reductase, partial [Planctomycetes bacterium]|nr:TlpA family protein disulfide reductase [Planctomycetota bacterium]